MIFQFNYYTESFTETDLKPVSSMEPKHSRKRIKKWKRLNEYFKNSKIIDKLTLTPKIVLDTQIIYQGFMSKRGGLPSKWQKRWFCVCADSTLRLINSDGECYQKIDLTNMRKAARYVWDPVNKNGTIKLWCIQRNWKFLITKKNTFENWRKHLEYMIKNPNVERSNILCSGYLDKKGQKNKFWRRRWCQLNCNGIFSYYKTKEGRSRGTFDLHHSTTLNLRKNRKGFSVVTYQPKRIWRFKTNSQSEAGRWISVINEFCAKLEVSTSNDSEGSQQELKSEKSVLSLPNGSNRRKIRSATLEDSVLSKGHHRINSINPLKSLQLKPRGRIRLRSSAVKPNSALLNELNGRKYCASVPSKKYFTEYLMQDEKDNETIPSHWSSFEQIENVDLANNERCSTSKLSDKGRRLSLSLIYPKRFLEAKRIRDSLETPNIPKEKDIYKLTISPRDSHDTSSSQQCVVKVASYGQNTILAPNIGVSATHRCKSDTPLIMVHSKMIDQKYFSPQTWQSENLENTVLDEMLGLSSEQEWSTHSDSQLSQQSNQSQNYSSEATSERIEDWPYKDVLRCAFYRFAGVSPYSDTNLRMSKPDLSILLECLGLERYCDNLYSSLGTDSDGLFAIGDFMDVFLNSETCSLITSSINYKFLVVTLITMKNFDPSYSKRVGYEDFLEMLSGFFTEDDDPQSIFIEYDTDGVGFLHVANLFCFLLDFFEVDDEEVEQKELEL